MYLSHSLYVEFLEGRLYLLLYILLLGQQYVRYGEVLIVNGPNTPILASLLENVDLVGCPS